MGTLIRQQLLDRRRFLGDFATGLGGIALASLLPEQRLLAADAQAPRRPHFTPRARRCCTSG